MAISSIKGFFDFYSILAAKPEGKKENDVTCPFSPTNVVAHNV